MESTIEQRLHVPIEPMRCYMNDLLVNYMQEDGSEQNFNKWFSSQFEPAFIVEFGRRAGILSKTDIPNLENAVFRYVIKHYHTQLRASAIETLFGDLEEHLDLIPSQHKGVAPCAEEYRALCHVEANELPEVERLYVQAA